MHIKENLDRITELLATFSTQVEMSTSLGRTDIARVAQIMLVPLLQEVYGYQYLKDLDLSSHSNFPAVDLGDKNARVAVQVTATTDSEKVKDTLTKFVKHQLYRDYSRLVVILLTKKQSRYSGKGFDEATQGMLVFDKEQDIIDLRDLLKVISGLQMDQIRRVREILEANIGDGRRLFFECKCLNKTESLVLNLLQVMLPRKLYVASLYESVFDHTTNSRGRNSRFGDSRKLVMNALKARGLRFAVDWVVHEKQIVTFHDLNDESLPIYKLIDQATITDLSPDEYYGQDENYERVFKSLLRKCLQQKLYKRHVSWQDREQLFIFGPVDGENERKETWRGIKESERTVFVRKMKDNMPNEVLSCKHLAFRADFCLINGYWHMQIMPEWFISYDGYHRSAYADKSLSYLKRQENNLAVYNHLRFLTCFLMSEEKLDLFSTKDNKYPFISFGDTLLIPNSRLLDDSDWLPHKAKEQGDEDDKDEIGYEQLELGIDL